MVVVATDDSTGLCGAAHDDEFDLATLFLLSKALEIVNAKERAWLMGLAEKIFVWW